MKKILIIFALLGQLLTSCQDTTGKEVLPEQYFEHIYCFDYKGHEYIYFGIRYRAGIVHSPECPCNKK